ncbi:hypothetical protein [Aquimarina aggregata]|uniref:hypothetical protein n=1 Tax=Aquimarina aggregata TaxID=1642818 RepID=UPI002493629E|nr:hypothetical protein [Aquimarina aggregata]
MANPKDIGKVFKEKLEGFNTTPSQLSWEDIESKLPKKEKRPLIYWIRIGSVLVLSSLLLTFGYITFTKTTIHNSNTNNIPQNTTIDHCVEPNFNKNNITDIKENKTIKEDYLDTIRSIKEEINTKTDVVSHYTNTSTDSKSNLPIAQSKNNKFGSKASKSSSSSSSSSTIKDANTYQKSLSNNDHNSINNDTLSFQFSNSKNKNITNHVLTDSSGIAKTPKDSLDSESLIKKEEVVAKRKPKDSLIYLKPKKKPLFQKFSIGVHLTPTYTFTPKGSLLSNLIANNKNNGRISLNYGILFKTYYSKKTALRIGYNRTKLSSITKSIPSDQIEIVLRDVGISLPNNFIVEDINTLDLVQKISYNEISFGAQHQIIDRNIKTSILMGMNILFLDQNALSVRNSSNTIKVGSARNLQKASFNFNIGANFEHSITKHIYLNAEPIFNFQLKDASDTTESYRHLFFTLQTGLSYKF